MGILLKSDSEVASLLGTIRQQGKTIVTINGCFDLLHSGHIYILSEAAKQGDILVVGLNSDASVVRNKGNTRPLIPEAERAELLCSLEMVDFVVIFPEKDCINFVKRISPDVHVNDSHYGWNCIERQSVEESGGRLHICNKIEGESTTDIIKKIGKYFN